MEASPHCGPRKTEKPRSQWFTMQRTATMKRICSILLAANSFLWFPSAVGAVRPHFGGTLRVAAKLRASNPSWKIVPAGDAIMIETDAADLQLPAELALDRNGIFRRASSKISGTGPFVVAQWESRHLSLKANDQYWAGRPFLD